MRQIPVNTPLLNGNEKKYVEECIRSGWVSSEGPFVRRFEEKFASYIGRSFGISCSNGSGALDIAMAALQISPGDEVIMPTFTIISPAFSVLRAGATPVLVDCERNTFNIDTTLIESKITKNTKAILVVHIYGHPVDMDPVIALCKKYSLKLIEDAAEMHGQTYRGKKCGSFGDISVFSFYANKHITTGEGGMIITDDVQLAERCRKLRNLAFEPDKQRFVHYEMGWNYRMTNIQAALGVAQLEQIDRFLKLKCEHGEMYADGLAFLLKYGYELPLAQTDHSKNIYWVFTLLAPDEEQRQKVIDHLNKDQIGTRPFFWPMHEQPVFRSRSLFIGQRYVNAESIARRGFYVPSGLGLTQKDIRRVIKSLRTIYVQGNSRKKIS